MGIGKGSGRGGRRPGSGPKRKDAPRVTYSVDITLQQAEYLKTWGGGDLSAGLRWLVDTAIPLVRRKDHRRTE